MVQPGLTGVGRHAAQTVQLQAEAQTPPELGTMTPAMRAVRLTALPPSGSRGLHEGLALCLCSGDGWMVTQNGPWTTEMARRAEPSP
jgi:hypothetical protein